MFTVFIFDNNVFLLEVFDAFSFAFEYIAVIVSLALIFSKKLTLPSGQITSIKSTFLSLPKPKNIPGSTEEKKPLVTIFSETCILLP